MNTEKLDKIWKEIIDKEKESTRRMEGEITIQEYMKISGFSTWKARRSMKNLIDTGVVRVRKTYIDEVRSTVNLYSIIDD